MKDDDRSPKLSASNDELLLLAIRIVCLGFLGYWSLILIRPFLTIIVWSMIIAVALYPIFDWLSVKLYGHRALAAIAITILSLLVMLGPATWLALSLAETARILLARLGDGTLTFPAPSATVKAWPLIGEKIYENWLLASTNLRALVIEAAPHLKPLGSSLLNAAGSMGINLLKFIIAVVISGFLLIPGSSLIHSIKNVLGRVAAARGEEFVDLAGATIRNVSRGIIGIAILQALLAGIGLLFAGVPAAGLFSFLVLVLGIFQIAVGHLTAAGHMELVCDGCDQGDSVYPLHGAGEFARQHITTARSKRPGNTDACNINRGLRRHAGAWHDWSICRTDCTFDRLAVDRGLDTRCAVTHEPGRMMLRSYWGTAARGCPSWQLRL